MVCWSVEGTDSWYGVLVCRGYRLLVWCVGVYREQTVGMVCWCVEGRDSWYGVLVCRGNRHILGLHSSSQVRMHLSTFDWILCTRFKISLDIVHMVVKLIYKYYFSIIAKYIY